MQGRFEAAVADYTSAIKQNPRHCRAYYNRAYSNDRLHRYKAAVADYTSALEIEPNNATAFHNRGSLHERLGDSQAALSDFQRAIDLEPNGPLSFNARGLLLEKEGQLESALENFDRAAFLRPDQPIFVRNRALCHRTCGNHAEAVADHTKCVSDKRCGLELCCHHQNLSAKCHQVLFCWLIRGLVRPGIWPCGFCHGLNVHYVNEHYMASSACYMSCCVCMEQVSYCQACRGQLRLENNPDDRPLRCCFLRGLL